MRKLFLLFIIALFSLSVAAQTPSGNFDLSDYGVKIEPDRRLIVVLASLEMAGLETPLGEDGEQFRAKLKTDLGAMDEDLKTRMRSFVVQYRKRHPQLSTSQTIAPFISMAYTLSPAPGFDEPQRSIDLPDDLLEVLDYAPLVREFYRRSGISSKLDEYVKTYQKAGDEMRPSAISMIQELLDFLNTKPETSYIEKIKTQEAASKSKRRKIQQTEIVERERRFFVVPEMFAPKDTLNFRNIKDNYYVIVSPGTDLTNSETRRAYLQFVIDPLILDNAKDILEKRAAIKTLLDAQRLKNPNISPDVFLAVSRSMVAAADAKEIEHRKINVATNQARQKITQLKTDTEKRAFAAELDKYKQTLYDETALTLSEAYQNGAVLSFYFARQFDGLGGSGFDVAASMKDIILSIDPSKENDRLAEFSENGARAAKRRLEKEKNSSATALISENPVTAKLLEIDKIIEAKDYVQANAELKILLEKNPDPRIHYALGRVTSLSAETLKDPEQRNKKLAEAELFYSNAIRASTKSTDLELIALSYLAIGRIYEFRGQTEYAVKIYEKAMEFVAANPASQPYKQAAEARERLIKDQ